MHIHNANKIGTYSASEALHYAIRLAYICISLHCIANVLQMYCKHIAGVLQNIVFVLQDIAGILQSIASVLQTYFIALRKY